MSMTANSAINAYSSVKKESANYADPHELITMLMDGALQRMGQAILAGREKRLAERTRLISQTIAIIDGLRGCLSKEDGKELAENLDNLYEYMGRRLLSCMANNDPEPIEEVRALLSEIFSAWASIPLEHRTPQS